MHIPVSRVPVILVALVVALFGAPGLVLGAGPPGAGGGAADQVATLLDRGQRALGKGDTAGALAAFDAAAALDPRDARAFYLRGVVLEQKGDRQGAEAAYRTAIGKKADFPEAENNLGGLLLARGDAAAAARAFEAASRARAGGWAEAWFNLGVARDALGASAPAVAAYREAVRLKPTDAGYRMNLGVALRRTGDLGGALAALRDAARMAPRNADIWTNLGMVESDGKQYDAAAASLEKATALDPGAALAWNRLGRVELRRGHVDRAVEASARAWKLAPTNSGFAADACRTLIEKKDTGRAVAECRAAVKLDARNPLARYELVKALAAHGDCSGAHQELERFRGLAGVKPEAKAEAGAMADACAASRGRSGPPHP
jgi:Flp pilus assembly protein TadD